MSDRKTPYLKALHQKFEELERMWDDPHVQLYDDVDMPTDLEGTPSVFLGGPTSRNQLIQCNWRSRAVALLRGAGFGGWIFCPEPRGEEERSGDFTEKERIHFWESDRLLAASFPTFWIPRKGDELLGLNTNLEFGVFLGMALVQGLGHRKLFVGWPDAAARMGLPAHYTNLANNFRHRRLEDLCEAIARAV